MNPIADCSNPPREDKDWTRFQDGVAKRPTPAQQAASYFGKLRASIQQYHKLNPNHKLHPNHKRRAPLFYGTSSNAQVQASKHLKLEHGTASSLPRTPVSSTPDLEARPKTLRGIIQSRMASSDAKSSNNKESNYAPIVPPIPMEILDVELTGLDLESADDLVSIISGSIHDDLGVRKCPGCCVTRFYPLRYLGLLEPFRQLSEFSCQVSSKGHLNHCSSCLLREMFHDIGSNWYRQIEHGSTLPGSSLECRAYKWGEVPDVLNNLISSVDEQDRKTTIAFFLRVFDFRTAFCNAFKNFQPQHGSWSERMNRTITLYESLFAEGYLYHSFDLCTVAAQLVNGDSAFKPGEIIWGTLSRGSPGLKLPIMTSMFMRQPTARQCIICAEEKFEIDYGTWEQWEEAWKGFDGRLAWTLLEYPVSHTQKCSHALCVCRACIKRHIFMHIQAGRLTNIPCPNCRRPFSHDEVRMLVDEDVYERYDKLLLVQTLSKDPNFRWCLGPKCESGQICLDVVEYPKTSCDDCGFEMCAFHGCAWHEGLICAEYETKLKNEEPTETKKLIESSTKACPACGVRIEKGNGCFHLTCSSCNHAFCWECLAPWSEVRVSRSGHRENCYFRTSRFLPTTLAGRNLRSALEEEARWEPFHPRAP